VFCVYVMGEVEITSTCPTLSADRIARFSGERGEL
jgi:hypothetical protein